MTFRASDPEKVFDYTEKYPSDYTISKVRDELLKGANPGGFLYVYLYFLLTFLLI